jgi:predicted RND superfamily exporter protein
VPAHEAGKLEDSSMRMYARFTERYGWAVYAMVAIIIVVCGYGITKLKVENRFIDYFRENTEIYRGMSVIDQRLGGTTPLEVVLEADGKDFWLEKENLAKLRQVHEWVDAQPESGKVLSPDTMMRVAEGVNKGQPIPTPLLKAMLLVIPQDIQEAVIKPYMTPERDKVRIALRAEESSKSLDRKDLMQRFDEYFKTDPIFADGTIRPRATGVFVLYNNMLQSLYQSQIKTIAVSYGVIWIMFMILFRSPTLATIAFLPNVPPVMMTLGVMGLAGIPLNILTIMIAGVSLGEAVDFALHYIHRFRHEYHVDKNYKAAMYRCHNSIGRAIYYTTITTVVGFAIVCLSNFIPNVYFGLFTAMALIVGFLASMTLLPLLIITLKPFGPDASKINAAATATT